MPEDAALDAFYLHIPFCFHKCHYCDFYSLVEPAESTDRQAAFTDRLIAELRWRADQCRIQPRTFFIGGGTPTFLRHEHWRRLLNILQELNLLTTLQEFTVEANPETVTPEILDLLCSSGVNRLSLGAQSFDPALLKFLERWHDPASVSRAVNLARRAGIANINLDLIFAIPGQTLTQLDQDLDRALELQPDHLSCYSLSYEPHTALTQRWQLGQFTPLVEETDSAMYQRIMDRLKSAGFEHYEISNWARPGRRCRHNLVYWTNGNWLGFGPSAASHVNGRRWKNAAHLGRYLASAAAPPIVDEECLPPARRIGEQIMLRLRLCEGMPLAWLQDHLPPADARWQTIAELVMLDMLQRTATHLRLTRRSLFLADAVIAKLL